MTALLILLCGRSFAGKSTAAARLRDRAGCIVVSLDEINVRRGLRSGSGVPIEEWERTYEIARAEARSALRDSDRVVVDDTSSLRFLRDRWRTLAAEESAGFRLVMVAAEAAELERRRASARLDRSRPGVDEAVLASHLASFEDPAPDEDALIIHSDEDPSLWVERLRIS